MRHGWRSEYVQGPLVVLVLLGIAHREDSSSTLYDIFRADADAAWSIVKPWNVIRCRGRGPAEEGMAIRQYQEARGGSGVPSVESGAYPPRLGDIALVQEKACFGR